MRIALVAPPFIAVPPPRYGGTELFLAELAKGLDRGGHDVVVYANGESELPCEVRWLYPESDWPLPSESDGLLKDLNHTAWAIRDAAGRADVIHLNSAPGLLFSRFVAVPFVYTLHHAEEPSLTELYRRLPGVHYVTISHFQRLREPMPRMTTIHHGIDLDRYAFVESKRHYLSFLGRISPSKAPHLAIEAARKADIPLKIAGEIQPAFRAYWESEVKPRIDGRFIEYVGEADHRAKQELLGNSMAMLFPIQWNEPFGLVMIESMACGTPVLALPGGSVSEVVKSGVSGWVCRDIDEMAARARSLGIPAAACRRHASENFSVDLMVERYERLYRALAQSTQPRQRHLAERAGSQLSLADPAAPQLIADS
ncbi:MAG: glycosyltransferase family 4 protein [Vicinamibacterales bacterium]